MKACPGVLVVNVYSARCTWLTLTHDLSVYTPLKTAHLSSRRYQSASMHKSTTFAKPLCLAYNNKLCMLQQHIALQLTVYAMVMSNTQSIVWLHRVMHDTPSNY